LWAGFDGSNVRLLQRKSKKRAASWSVAFVEVGTINIYWGAFSRCGGLLKVWEQFLEITSR
jgi:hypothetical protein